MTHSWEQFVEIANMQHTVTIALEYRNVVISLHSVWTWVWKGFFAKKRPVCNWHVILVILYKQLFVFCHFTINKSVCLNTKSCMCWTGHTYCMLGFKPAAGGWSVHSSVCVGVRLARTCAAGTWLWRRLSVSCRQNVPSAWNSSPAPA